MSSPVTPQPSAAADAIATNEPLARAAKSGANWLYWIAGMSLINQILQISEANMRFAIGLGATDLIQAIGQAIGPAFRVIGLILDFGIIAAIAALGFLANKLHRWAYIVGLIVVALDTLLLLWIAPGDSILSIVFHAWAGFSIWIGFNAARKLHQSAAAAVSAANSAAVPPVLPAPSAAPTEPPSGNVTTGS